MKRKVTSLITYNDDWCEELPFCLLPINKEDYKDNYDEETILIYNPLTKTIKLERNDKNSIIHSKYAYEGLKFWKVITNEN